MNFVDLMAATASRVFKDDPTMSHVVLQNEELLESIFSHLEEKPSLTMEWNARKSMFHASLTCKSFVQPALNLLWRRMKSITPLLKILPMFVKVSNGYTLIEAIQQTHIERFLMYARKIRVLCIEKNPDLIEGHCIHRLLSTPNLVLFPALKHFHLKSLASSSHCHDAYVENYTALFLLNGSLLASISINNIASRNQPLVSSLLLNLSQKAPAVEDIELSGELSSEVLGFLARFRKLQSVCLTAESSGFSISMLLRNLRDLPSLNRLHLNLGDTTLEVEGQTDHGGFPALESLELRGTPGELVKTLIHFSEVPKLRILNQTLYFTRMRYPDPLPLSISDLENHIAESCRIAPNMTDFIFEVPRPTREEGYVATSTSDILSLLKKCPQITNLQLGGITLGIDDKQIRQISESGAWRNLRNFGFPRCGRQGSAPSLSSLCVLTENCPNLNSLNITIDFALRTPSSLQQERRYPRISHPLQSLSIMSRYKGSDDTRDTELAIAVARFLEHNFPDLSTSKIRFSPTEYHSWGIPKWGKIIRKNITEFRSLRADVESDIFRRLNVAM